MRYVVGWGWLTWDTVCWHRDREDIRLRAQVDAMMETLRDRLLDQPKEQTTDERRRVEALKTHYHRSNHTSRVTSMLREARGKPGMQMQTGEFDRDPWLFNCTNGTVDLRTGELREHRREDYLTLASEVAYVPDAQHDVWTRFLFETTGGDAELCAYMQHAAGYSLTGSTREKVLFFGYGPTDAGKGTFVDALLSAMGEYGKVADFGTFLDRRDHPGGARDDLADLRGARLVVSQEMKQGEKLAEGLVKTLTGGEQVKARHLYQEGFTFRPAFKLWLMANDPPQVRDDDEALWNRMRRIPFQYRVPPHLVDPSIKATFQDDPEARSAVLAWMVAGCLAWQREGLATPASVAASTATYRREMDPLAEWIEECCVVAEDVWTVSAELWQNYETWTGGRPPMTQDAFGKRLNGRGWTVHVRRIGGKLARVRLGIGLLTSEYREFSQSPVTPVAPVTPVTGDDGEDVSEDVLQSPVTPVTSDRPDGEPVTPSENLNLDVTRVTGVTGNSLLYVNVKEKEKEVYIYNKRGEPVTPVTRVTGENQYRTMPGTVCEVEGCSEPCIDVDTLCAAHYAVAKERGWL